MSDKDTWENEKDEPSDDWPFSDDEFTDEDLEDWDEIDEVGDFEKIEDDRAF